MPIIQFGMPTCQNLANFSTWCANVPNGVPIFHFGMPACQMTCQIFIHSSYEMLRGFLYFIIIWKILHYTWYQSYAYDICIYVSYIKIILYFISILHVILKKSVRNFFFLKLFCSLVNLFVTSSKDFLKFSSAKTTKQNKEYVWILWSSWIRIFLNWRSEIVIRNFILTMFLSVSYHYVFEYCSSCSTVVS